MSDFLRRLFGGGGGGDDDEGGAPQLGIETVRVAGKHALRERQQLLAREGVTPVILGSAEDARLMEEILAESDAQPEAILLEAAALDLEGWMRARVAGDPEHYATHPEPWPEGEPDPTELSVHLDELTHRPKAAVYIGLFPTPRAWEVPAHARYGAWNECPEPAVHVALHRRWSERHGAAIACMSSDVIECTVERPPATRDEAMALAREQFVYCPDIVDQGVGSVEALAALLLHARTWYFWWD